MVDDKNRPFVFNRDKGVCKICNNRLDSKETEIHHVNDKLKKSEINKLKNLICCCYKCHKLIHINEIPNSIKLDKKVIDKLNKYRSFHLK